MMFSPLLVEARAHPLGFREQSRRGRYLSHIPIATNDNRPLLFIRMNIDIQRASRALNIALFLFLTGFVALIASVTPRSDPAPALAMVGVFYWTISAISVYVLLGRAAANLGRSWVWNLRVSEWNCLF